MDLSITLVPPRAQLIDDFVARKDKRVGSGVDGFVLSSLPHADSADHIVEMRRLVMAAEVNGGVAGADQLIVGAALQLNVSLRLCLICLSVVRHLVGSENVVAIFDYDFSGHRPQIALLGELVVLHV